MQGNMLLLDKRTKGLVGDYVPTDDILNGLVNFFTMFADNTRIRMLSALAISEMCVTDLATILDLNQTTVSHQLRILRNLNAVMSRRQGKIIFYSLKTDLLNEVMLKGLEYLAI